MNSDPTELQAVFEHLGQMKGAIGLVAGAIFLLIRLYRLPQWQESLPAVARWENLHVMARYGIIAALAGIGGGLAAAAQGQRWQEALLAAGSAAIAAIVANKATKTEPARALAQVVVPPAKGAEPAVTTPPL